MARQPSSAAMELPSTGASIGDSARTTAIFDVTLSRFSTGSRSRRIAWPRMIAPADAAPCTMRGAYITSTLGANMHAALEAV